MRFPRGNEGAVVRVSRPRRSRIVYRCGIPSFFPSQQVSQGSLFLEHGWTCSRESVCQGGADVLLIDSEAVSQRYILDKSGDGNGTVSHSSSELRDRKHRHKRTT